MMCKRGDMISRDVAAVIGLFCLHFALQFCQFDLIFFHLFQVGLEISQFFLLLIHFLLPYL